jgi:hypothetical protein
VPALLTARADVSVDDVMRDARKALGGEQAIAKVAGLSAEGTFRRTFGQREMSGDVEFAMAFPDRYIRVETFSFTGDPGNRAIRTAGFDADEALDGFTGGGAGMGMGRFGGMGPGGPGAQPGQPGQGDQGRQPNPERLARMVKAHKLDASRLVLAMLARADAVQPLEVTYAGEAESPDGKAHVLEAKLEGAVFRLFIDQQSHLPLMLAYREPAPRMPQRPQPQPGQPAPTREEMEKMMREARERAEREPPKLQDVEIFFSDHKKVDGVLLPHTIRRAVDGNVTEELSIAKFKVNPAFKPDTFKKR